MWKWVYKVLSKGYLLKSVERRKPRNKEGGEREK